MKKAVIFPGKARGRVKAPPSKSMAHRLMICSFLAEGDLILPESDSMDTLATRRCLEELERFRRGEAAPDSLRLPAGESGSTLRFLLPYALTLSEKVTFTGAERLFERPLSVYEDICRQKGFLFEKEKASLTVRGDLAPDTYKCPGNISSQFVSGLLFALPLLEGGSKIMLEPPVESLPYIEMTLKALSLFGVKAVRRDNVIEIPGKQRYVPCRASVEGDYSNAAFLSALSLFGGEVEVEGLLPDSVQGDRIYGEYFARLARGFAELDISDCPDLGPVLFAVAAGLSGGRFTGTARLRLKESDRAAAMEKELLKFGIRCRNGENSFTVFPGVPKKPEAPLSGHNDHRIVMALCTLLTVTGGELLGAEAADKSFPEYFDTLKKLGIKAEIYAVDQ